jgi:regulator of sirC expression with transglutaminase-like and TPR domain
MAKDIASYFPQKATGEEKLKILVFQLFKEMGYHGSTLDYNHPSNSYINEVIDDREGLPITLSVLFIELANRLELPVSGLGIPGHFLAMYRDDSDKKSKEIIIDPFGGKIITRDEASIITGLRLNDKDFVPASKRDIITRMLRNLIHTAESQRNSSDRLLYINAILAIDPTDSYTRALRAMIHYGEGQFQNALKDINNLISENPNNPEMAPLLEIRNRLIEKKLSP